MSASACGSRSTAAQNVNPRSSIAGLSHSARGIERSGDDWHVTRAAAQMPAKVFAHRRLTGIRMIPQKGIERHQYARCAEAALQCMMAAEGLLQDRQAIGGGSEILDGANVATLDLYGQGQARARRPAVDLDGAGPAHAVLAADVGAG